MTTLETDLLAQAVRGLGDGCVSLDSARLRGVDDFVIVNRVSWEGEVWTALPAFVIDFTVEEPDTYFLPVAGLAAPAPVVG